MPKGLQGFQKGNQIGKNRIVTDKTKMKLSKSLIGKNKKNHLVRYIEDKNGCWIWQGCFRSSSGYGVIHFKKGNGGIVFAHRYFYENKYGKIPKRMLACHKCDNPSCVNPEHIFIGTQQDNVNDKVKKIRQSFGEKCNRGILKNKDVLKIKKELKNGISQRLLARLYNVDNTTISKINTGKNWKQI